MRFRHNLAQFRYYDWILLFSIILLLSFSFAALYGIAQRNESPDFSFLYRQLIFSALGLAVFFSVSFLNYQIFSFYAYHLYIFSGIFLVGVLAVGVTFQGTRGWIELYGYTLQPVEIAKFSLIVVLAKIFSAVPQEFRDWKFILKTGGLTLAYFFLVMLQPDFGSGILLVFLWLGFLFISGTRLKFFLAIFGIMLLSFIFSWFFVFQNFQKDRIVSFFQPTRDPLGRGYHVRQSIIAIGSGNIFGKGLASGSQSQLRFIPASQTDFIFAVIGEELGFFGAFVLLVLYGSIFFRLGAILKKTNDNFAMYLILGISILFFSQFVINVGMNLGIMPVTGISLPFLSYGGSFLVTSLLFMGVIESIFIRTVKFKV